MSDPDIYDEVDDEPRRPRFRWEYVNCNSIPVPEHFDDDELVDANVTDKEDDEEA